MWTLTTRQVRKANDGLTEYARLEYGSSEAEWIVTRLRRDTKRAAQSRKNILRRLFGRRRRSLKVIREPVTGLIPPMEKSPVVTEAEGGACG